MNRYLKKILKPVYFDRKREYPWQFDIPPECMQNLYLKQIEKESVALRCWLLILSVTNVLTLGMIVFYVIQ